MTSGGIRDRSVASIADHWHEPRRSRDPHEEMRRVDRPDGRGPLRFGLGCAALGGALLMGAAVWVSTCSGNTVDVMACGRPQLTLLALAAPIVLAGGGLWALGRFYQCRRRDGGWRAWLAAGWFLLTVLVVVVTMSLPTFTDPAIGL